MDCAKGSASVEALLLVVLFIVPLFIVAKISFQIRLNQQVAIKSARAVAWDIANETASLTKDKTYQPESLADTYNVKYLGDFEVRTENPGKPAPPLPIELSDVTLVVQNFLGQVGGQIDSQLKEIQDKFKTFQDDLKNNPLNVIEDLIREEGKPIEAVDFESGYELKSIKGQVEKDQRRWELVMGDEDNCLIANIGDGKSRLGQLVEVASEIFDAAGEVGIDSEDLETEFDEIAGGGKFDQTSRIISGLFESSQGAHGEQNVLSFFVFPIDVAFNAVRRSIKVDPSDGYGSDAKQRFCVDFNFLQELPYAEDTIEAYFKVLGKDGTTEFLNFPLDCLSKYDGSGPLGVNPGGWHHFRFTLEYDPNYLGDGFGWGDAKVLIDDKEAPAQSAPSSGEIGSIEFGAKLEGVAEYYIDHVEIKWLEGGDSLLPEIPSFKLPNESILGLFMASKMKIGEYARAHVTANQDFQFPFDEEGLTLAYQSSHSVRRETHSFEQYPKHVNEIQKMVQIHEITKSGASNPGEAAQSIMDRGILNYMLRDPIAKGDYWDPQVPITDDTFTSLGMLVSNPVTGQRFENRFLKVKDGVNNVTNSEAFSYIGTIVALSGRWKKN